MLKQTLEEIKKKLRETEEEFKKEISSANPPLFPYCRHALRLMCQTDRAEIKKNRMTAAVIIYQIPLIRYYHSYINF